jgi:hypothetical protein
MIIKLWDGREFNPKGGMPVMVILTQKDKENITKMLPEATMYCEFDENFYHRDDVNEWMDEQQDATC